jgi:predicted alpha/beta-hydrolase family hydrolase
MSTTSELHFVAAPGAGQVSALLDRLSDARWLLALAHGAGAGMRHAFMNDIVRRLGARGVATFRYQFPYMERGAGRPDPQPVLLECVRSAIAAAHDAASDLPLIAGGKSMGGRMTSNAAAEGPLAGVRGLVFFGFPLHPPGAPGTSRAKHLDDVTVPMLFLQGTRDTFAGLDLLSPVVEKLGPRATIHVIDGADHSFGVLKRTGRTNADVLDELAKTVVEWADAVG